MFNSISRSANRHRAQLEVIRLEERDVPIVGGLGVPNILTPGAGADAALRFAGINTDGVVRVENDGGRGTGALVETKIGVGDGAILTAAHVSNGLLSSAIFELRRGPGMDVEIEFLNLPDFAHTSANVKADAFDFDMAIMPLVDNDSKRLVAPFGPPMYTYADSSSKIALIGSAFAMIGYGRSGVGDKGAILNYGFRRGGQNQVDIAEGQTLRYDFDSGLTVHDSLGKDLGLVAGKTVVDTLADSGDSGGPNFIDGVIVGTFTSGTGSVYGAIGRVTRTDTNIGDKNIQQGLGFEKNGNVIAYDLVLDMNKQVLGLDGKTEAFTIVAERDEQGNLTLRIQGSKAGPNDDGFTYDNYNGLYYSAPAANIKSLTILGSGDNETFVINGELWSAAERAAKPAIPRSIYIDGGGGVSSLEIDTTTGSPADGVAFKFRGAAGSFNTMSVVGDGSFELLSDPASAAQNVLGVNFGKITALNVQSTSLLGGNGNSLVTLGNWNGAINLDGGGGTDTLIAAADSDFRLIGSQIEFGAKLAYQFKNFERAELTGGAGSNKFSIGWNGSTAIKGEGGIDLVGILGGVGNVKLDGVEVFSMVGGDVTLDNNVLLTEFILHDGAFRTSRLMQTSYGQWDGGSISGLGPDFKAEIQFVKNGAFKIAGLASGLEDAIFVNEGDLTLSSGLDITLQNSVIENAGILHLDGASKLTGKAANNVLPVLRNLAGGKIIKTGDDQVARFMGLQVSNAGDFEIEQGRLVLSVDYVQTAGTTTFGVGSALRVNEGSVRIDGGVLQGRPEYVLASLINSAIVAPGGVGSIGGINVLGNYEQKAGATLAIDLHDSTNKGRDWVSARAVTLKGTLSVNLLPNFVPGDKFTILENTLGKSDPNFNIVGTFDNLPERKIFQVGAERFRISYVGGDGNDVVLTRMADPMRVQLKWSPSGDAFASDFNLGSKFLGGLAGWPYEEQDPPYQHFGGNVTSSAVGYEETFSEVFKALEEEQWSGSTTIDLTGAWWANRPDPELQTDFHVDLAVSWNGVTLTRLGIEVLAQSSGFATGTVGTITVYEDGTFTFSGGGSDSIAPTDLSLSNSSVYENAEAGTVVGDLSASSDSAVTFSLVAGSGDGDNDLFEIVDNQVRTLAPLDYERPYPYSIRVQACDADGDATEQIFTLTILDVNDAPLIVGPPDPVAVDENALPGKYLTALIAIDDDPDTTLTYDLSGGDGLFAIDEEGRVYLTASPNYEQSTSYTLYLSVSDGFTTVSTTLEVSINDLDDINQAPAGADATVSTPEDTAITLTALDFGFDDGDDGNYLAAVVIASLPASGMLALDGVAVTAGDVISADDLYAGKLTYTPAVNANGAGYASFQFQVRDDGGTADGGSDTDPTLRTLTIDVSSVNDAPAGADATVTTLEDTDYTFTASDFALTDADDDPSPNSLKEIVIVSLPTAGTLKLDGVEVEVGDVISVSDLIGGKLTFTPAENENGTGYASFQFRVVDDGGTEEGGSDTDPAARTLTLDLTPVNDAPTGTDKTLTTLEDTPYVFTLGDFELTDSVDSPANALSGVVVTSLPSVGSLTLNGNALGVGVLVSAADIAAGKLVFTPDANTSGESYASLEFQVVDDGGTDDGGIDTDPTPRTMTIDVTSVNDAPAGIDTTVATLEDTPYVFTLGDFERVQLPLPQAALANVRG